MRSYDMRETHAQKYRNIINAHEGYEEDLEVFYDCLRLENRKYFVFCCLDTEQINYY